MSTFRILVICWVCWAEVVARGEDARPDGADAASCVILIGGIDSDPTAAQIDGTARRGVGQSGMYQLAGDLAREGFVTEYFNWNGTRAGKIKEKPPLAAGIAKFIMDRQAEHPAGRLAIVANSWGGHTSWEVCQALPEAGVSIELAIFLDPSSTGRSGTPRPASLPVCINSARNYYTRNLFGWREWPDEKRLVNVDLGDAKHGFLVPGGPKYDSAFDTHAHIAAEWDPRIHKDITQHLVGALKAEVAPSPVKPHETP